MVVIDDINIDIISDHFFSAMMIAKQHANKNNGSNSKANANSNIIVGSSSSRCIPINPNSKNKPNDVFIATATAI
jgi:hypothetical protein